MKDDEKNALIEHRIARATNTIEEVSFLIKNSVDKQKTCGTYISL